MRKIFQVALLLFSVISFGQTDTISTNLYQNGGKIGIGTMNPSRHLDISGNPGNGYSSGLRIAHAGLGEANYGWDIVQFCPNCYNAGSLTFHTNYNNKFNTFIFTQEGNMGIGFGVENYTLEEKLEVKGNIVIKDNNALILSSPGGLEYRITVDDNGNLVTTPVDNEVASTKTTSDMASNSVEIFPNPTYDILNIRLNGFISQQINMEIHEVSGRIIYSKNYKSSSFKVEMNSFPKGIYMLQLKDENENIITYEKFIKQ